MSNVLLGLIGVVLFVGLALASVVYLGPRIVGASASQNAQVVLGSIQQTSAAIRLQRLRTRSVVPDTTQFMNRLTSAGLLKAVPANPHLTAAPANSTTAGAWAYPVYTSSSTDNASLSSTVSNHTYVVMMLGSSRSAGSTCVEIQRALGATTLLTEADMSVSAAFSARRAVQPKGGCFLASSGIPGVASGNYVAYLAD